MNSYSGEGGLISFILLLLKGNAILPMTPKADCARGWNHVDMRAYTSQFQGP